MATDLSNSPQRNFAATVGRLGLTAVATSALAMLYKLAMPRALGPTELAQLYFAETFPFLFFALVPLGIGAFISRELAGRPREAREALPSILAFVAVAGAVAFLALLATLLWRDGAPEAPILASGMMALACLAIVIQQRILRPTFIALDAAGFVTRIEIAVKATLAVSVLTTLLLRPDLRIITSLHAAAETGAVIAYLVAATRRGWLGGGVRLATLKTVLKVSLPFSAVAVLMAVNGNVDSTLFTHLTDAHETGLYAAANRLGLVVIFGVSVVFSSILPMLGRVARESPNEYGDIFAGCVRTICAAGLPLVAAFTLAAPEASRLMFGAEFAPSWKALTVYGPYALIVAFNILASTNLALRASGRTFAVASAGALALNVTTAALAIASFCDGHGEGATGAARLVAGSLSDLCSAGVFLYLTRREVNAGKLLGTLALAVVPAASIAALQLSGQLTTITARVAVLVAVPLYMLAVGLVRRSDSGAVAGMMRDIFARRATHAPKPPAENVTAC